MKQEDNLLKIMRKSDILNESEILELLSSPEKVITAPEKDEVTELDKVVLRESLEKIVKILKEKKEFESAKSFENLLNDFNKLVFFVEFEDKDFIFYTFTRSTENTHHSLKSSGFFTLPKGKDTI